MRTDPGADRCECKAVLERRRDARPSDEEFRGHHLLGEQSEGEDGDSVPRSLLGGPPPAKPSSSRSRSKASARGLLSQQPRGRLVARADLDPEPVAEIEPIDRKLDDTRGAM